MPGAHEIGQTYDVECPHCHKRFSAEPITGGAARYSGFKCPHCKLFVPLDRVDPPDPGATA
jgi:hypothetical protein